MSTSHTPAPSLTAPEVVRGVVTSHQDAKPGTLLLADPSQVRRPWTATARTVLQFVLALAVLAPFVVAELDVDLTAVPYVAGALAALAGFARVMAMPQVEVFLRRFAPFLAAGGSATPGD